MPSAAILRLQIEAALAKRIPSALTPAPRIIRPVAATGVPELDSLLEGGLPLGAITEMVGPECSGRTSVALSFVAWMTHAGKVCAWVDVSNTLHPESAAAMGVDLSRLLWVRCGVQEPATQPTPNHFALPEKCLISPPAIQGLRSGDFGTHPRNEIKGLSKAVSGFLRSTPLQPQRGTHPEAPLTRGASKSSTQLQPRQSRTPRKPWSRIEQALRVTDLLLQAGGFSSIVLDMAGIAPEHASRIPLATWFRYRAAAERTQASILLLAQHSCARSSGELLLRFSPVNDRSGESTVSTGIEHRVEVARRRFTQAPDNVVPMRKPPQSASMATWQSQTTWAGSR